MMFIGVALLVAVGLALAISADAGSLVGLTEQQTGRLVPLVLILIVIAGGLFARQRHRMGEMLGNMAIWLGIFGIVVVGYAFRGEIGMVADRVMGEFSPGVAVVDSTGGTATFRRAFNGSFRVETEVNGARTPMIFDTGASAVVLTRRDARAAGIEVDRLRYDVPVQTANGMGRAAAVTLDTVVVGGIARNRIRAFVAEEAALETSLLGMTFLETLSGYSVDRDALELRD